MAINPEVKAATPPTLTEILAPIEQDLIRVEKALAAESASGIEPVRDITSHLLQAGGKRLRPALHLLTARFCGCEGDGPVRIGTVLELIHNATLIHDDIIDSADSRRGQESTNSRWGNSMTVLAGDWLYMQAFGVAVAERNFHLLDTLIQLTQALVEGELIQLTCLGKIDIDEARALDIARRKTARLFEASTQLAAILAGWEGENEAHLAEYGLKVGLAFQLVDDLLDFTAEESRLGKPVMSDLTEGKVTLPLVYAMEKGGADAREKIETVLRENKFDSVQPHEILDLLERTDALDRVRKTATSLVESATEALTGFPSTPERQMLEAVPQFILTRNH